MKCERCHNAEATKALSVEIDGQPSTVFVCDECAAKAAAQKGPSKGDGSHPVNTEGGVDVAARAQGISSISDMLLDMAKMVSSHQKGAKPPVFELHMRDGEGQGAKPEAEVESGVDPDAPVRCPECNLSLEELRDGRRFGCPHCYKTFHDEVLAFTQEMQFDDRHVGKKPYHVMRDMELHHLMIEYRKAIAREWFAEAKTIAERIRELGGTLEELPGEGSDEK